MIQQANVIPPDSGPSFLGTPQTRAGSRKIERGSLCFDRIGRPSTLGRTIGEGFTMDDLAQSELHGIAGWLILPILAVVIYVFYQVSSLVDIFGSDGLSKAFNLGSHPFQMSLASIVLGEVSLNLILLTLEGSLLFCLVRRKRIFPKIMIVWLVMLTAAAGVNPILSKAATAALNQSDNVVVVSGYDNNGYNSAPLVRTATHCTIWIVYFLKSRRVKAHFVN